MLRLLGLFLILFAWAAPARAQSDDVGAASRSVVRVAVAQFDGEQIVDFGHGSGFAVGPNRVVTNAHVVALAVSDPDNVRIGIIPAEGSQAGPARIVAVDPARDLALLEFQGGRLPPATLFTGRIAGGAAVAALGYPGNVDMATAQSFEDMLQPRPPSRSMGNFSDTRSSPVGPTMVHTADIARGHSGGPLVDACGRVVGVNVALTNNESGDASFGFAIPAASLQAFLREAGQTMSANASPLHQLRERERAEAERASAASGSEMRTRRRGCGRPTSARPGPWRLLRRRARLGSTSRCCCWSCVWRLWARRASWCSRTSTVRRSRWRGGGGPADRLGMGVHDAARAERRPSRRKRGSRSGNRGSVRGPQQLPAGPGA
jgi:hypothetical protein